MGPLTKRRLDEALGLGRAALGRGGQQVALEGEDVHILYGRAPHLFEDARKVLCRLFRIAGVGLADRILSTPVTEHPQGDPDVPTKVLGDGFGEQRRALLHTACMLPLVREALNRMTMAMPMLARATARAGDSVLMPTHFMALLRAWCVVWPCA